MKLRKNIYFSNCDKIILIIILILFVTYYLYYNINKFFYPVLLDYSSIETQKITTYIINNSLKNFDKNIGEMDEYSNVIKNSAGEIIGVDYNTIELNKNLLEITDSIQNDLNLFESGKYNVLNFNYVDKNIYFKNNKNSIVFFIPFGIATGISVLSDLGPKIPVKLSIIGSVKTNIKTNLQEYGINNSLMKVYIEVNVPIQVVLPFLSKKINVIEEIPLSIKLINGKIPEVYGSDYVTSSSDVISSS